jgi:formylglycine-generating enzyme required for sulfatase activity
MVYVPAGEFIMGSDPRKDEYAQDDEQPVRTVYLDAFYIDKYEVTNAQYRACVEAGACSQPRNTDWYNDPTRAMHPVVHVDWNQANDYCQCGYPPRPSGKKQRGEPMGGCGLGGIHSTLKK